MQRSSPLAEKESISPQDLWDKPLILSRQVDNKSGLYRWLGKELLEVRKNRILNKQQGFEQVKQYFYRETVRLKKKSEELELALKRGICFATENPGAGQEAALFLTRISEEPDIMGFIGEY